MRENETELRVLSAGIVAHSMEVHRSAVAQAIALSVVGGACPGLRLAVLLPEIVTLAQAYLFQKSLEVRSREGVTVPKVLSLKGEQLLRDVKPIAATNNLAGVVEAMGPVLDKLNESAAAVAASTSKSVSNMERLLASLAEQGNVLWWLFAGLSRDFRKPYRELSWPTACIVAGKELADLTELLPGPVSAPAVLDKILSDGRTPEEAVSLESVVAGADETWKRKCLETAEGRLDDFSPIHMAFRMSIDGASWVKQFEVNSGIKLRKSNIGAVGLACQMYIERLLQRAAQG